MTPLMEIDLLLVPTGMIVAFLIVSPLRERGWKHALEAGEDPKARLKLYSETMMVLWIMAAACTAFWLMSGRDLSSLGFRAADGGWRSWLVWGAAAAAAGYMVWSVVRLAASRHARDSVRKQIAAAGGVDLICPHTGAEHARFQWLAITAGVTEEIIFRGFLIGALALVMPVWAAALASVAVFTLAHLYQGPTGLVRVTATAAVLAALFVIGGSLWPVMILHAAIDLGGGGVFRIIGHFEAEDRTAGTA